MIEYCLVLFGFILLVYGSKYFVEGSSFLAKRLGVSSLTIGLTVVAFGTSMPEFIINIIAILNGSTELALGNVLGSNISNTLFILGAASLFFPLVVHKSVVWREIPLCIGATFLVLILSNDFLWNHQSLLGPLDGIILLLFFIYFLRYIYLSTSKKNNFKIDIPRHSDFVIGIMIVGGLFCLLGGGQLVVKNALIIARSFGVSDFLISATVLALGSSLPELVVSFIAGFKKNMDLVVGNIIGSNIFNLLYVLGVTSILKPISLSMIFNLDILFLLFITGLIFLFMFTSKKHEITKFEGFLMVILYLIYICLITIRG